MGGGPRRNAGDFSLADAPDGTADVESDDANDGDKVCSFSSAL